MKAIAELVAGYTTAPSTTETAITLADSEVTLVVRGTAGLAKAFMMPPWAKFQTSGKLRISSIAFPDNGVGMELRGYAASVRPLLPLTSLSLIELSGQQEVKAKMTGSATGGDLEMAVIPIIYPNPEQQPQFMSPEDVSARRLGTTILAIPNTIVTPTSGSWGTSEALNSEADPFDAKYDYAIIGFLVDTLCLAVAYSGQLTLKYRWGGPGNPDQKELTSSWFITMSRAMGYDLIPWFNGSDANKVFVNAITDENGADPNVTTLCVPLRR